MVWLANLLRHKIHPPLDSKLTFSWRGLWECLRLSGERNILDPTLVVTDIRHLWSVRLSVCLRYSSFHWALRSVLCESAAFTTLSLRGKYFFLPFFNFTALSFCHCLFYSYVFFFHILLSARLTQTQTRPRVSFCYAITQSDKSRIWGPTAKFLLCFSSLRCRRSDRDGLKKDTTKMYGRMWFGTCYIRLSYELAGKLKNFHELLVGLFRFQGWRLLVWLVFIYTLCLECTLCWFPWFTFNHRNRKKEKCFVQADKGNCVWKKSAKYEGVSRFAHKMWQFYKFGLIPYFLFLNSTTSKMFPPEQLKH